MVVCPNPECAQDLQFPKDKLNLELYCPTCGKTFRYSSQEPNHGMQKSNSAADFNSLYYVTGAIDKWSKSIAQVTLPSDLVSKCSIEEIADFSGKFISCQFLYGERTGEKDDIPYDGGEITNRISDLSIESLWKYGKNTFAEIPPKFDASKGLFSSKWKPFFIGTGKTRKCPSCRGRGRIICRKCKGRGSYESGFIGSTEKTWETCHCDNGYNDCGHCSEYGTIQDAIKCSTIYRTHSESRVIYLGPDFENCSSEKTIKMILHSTGGLLLEKVIEYPFEEMCNILKGGVDNSKYDQMQNMIRDETENIVQNMLNDTEHNIQMVYEALNKLLDYMPNPVQVNKVLEFELLPVRIRISVRRRPVFHVSYKYQEKPYVLWVFGDEGKIYASEKPREFTKEAKILALAASVIVFLFMCGVCGLTVYWLWNNGESLLNQVGVFIESLVK